APASESGADDEAGHRPDALVGPVLVSTHPGNAVDARQSRVRRAWLDGAPTGGFVVEIRDEPARRRRLGVARGRLRAEPGSAFVSRKRTERLPRPALVPLALARRGGPARAEHGLEGLPARRVGRHDREPR